MVEKLNIEDFNFNQVEVKYLGDKVFHDCNLIENSLIFKKRNSKQLNISILIPTTINLDFLLKKTIDSIILIYNQKNPKSYLTKYRDLTVGITDNLYKQNIYQVKFNIYDKEEIMYFDIDKKHFFN